MLTRAQLLDLGSTPREISQALATKRLHVVHRGIYALGRPELSREGRWMAAVLACGPGALLSHGSAAALWGIGDYERGRPEVSVPSRSPRRRPGIRVYRRAGLSPADRAVRHGIPVTTPVCTVIDLAARLGPRHLEDLVNEAANQDRLNPEELRAALVPSPGRAGVPDLRDVLDRHTFRLTRSRLERLFLALAREAGLPTPQTRVHLNGFEVDFYFEELGLVVETDGLRYHRTPGQQARDRVRDQAHLAAGLTPLRFTHAQVRYDAAHVRGVLRTMARRRSVNTSLPDVG